MIDWLILLRRRTPGDPDGFSLVELLLAVAVIVLVMGAVFAIMNASESRFGTELEAADMEQRVRIVTDALASDLMMAGAGIDSSTADGPVVYSFPPILPFRQGALNDDPPGTFRADTLTLFYVPSSAARSTLTTAVGPGQSALHVDQHSGCPSGSTACGFAAGMTIVIYDGSGATTLLPSRPWLEMPGPSASIALEALWAHRFPRGRRSHRWFSEPTTSGRIRQARHFN